MRPTVGKIVVTKTMSLMKRLFTPEMFAQSALSTVLSTALSTGINARNMATLPQRFNWEG
jgi:hypothetical protein